MEDQLDNADVEILCFGVAIYAGDHTALAKEMRGCSPILARPWGSAPCSALGVIGNGQNN